MKLSCLFQITAALASVAITSAAPIPTGGPIASPGDGINERLVQFSPSTVHNITAAVAALSLGPGDPGYVDEFNGVASQIDIADGSYGGEITPGHDGIPFGGPDPFFATRFSGFLNVTTAGDYAFRSYTDDGFRLTLGGEIISHFDTDRSPSASVTGAISLAAGLYAIEFVGWEQGGAFVNELSWLTPGAIDFAVPDSAVLFTAVPGVPDAGSSATLLGIAGTCLAALSARRRSLR